MKWKPLVSKTRVGAMNAVTAILFSLLTAGGTQAPLAAEREGDAKKSAEFKREPIGPILGHVDTKQVLAHYRAAKEGDYTLEVTPGSVKSPLGGSAAIAVTAATKKEADYTVKWRVKGLQPDTQYRFRVLQGKKVVAKGGTFRTAPDPEKPATVSLGFGSCVNSKGDEPLWAQVLTSGCNGFVMLGDTPYIDSPRLEHIRPKRRQLLRLLDRTGVTGRIPFWWTWDDHDSMIRGNKEQWKKDSCRQAFVQYTALDSYGQKDQGIFTKFRYGPVDVFVIDTRWWYRTEPSFADATKASLIGKPQWDWLQRELTASTAPFKLLANGVIWYRKISEGDSWGHYPHERDAVFKWLGEAKISGVVLIGGDIHASSASVFKTREQVGYDLHAFTVSPLHDGVMERHNYKDRDYIKWGRAVPNVFLRVTADSTCHPPTLTATWIQMSGEKVHEVKIKLDHLQP